MYITKEYLLITKRTKIVCLDFLITVGLALSYTAAMIEPVARLMGTTACHKNHAN